MAFSKYSVLGVTECSDARILWCFTVSAYRDFRFLGFRDFGILGFWDFGILGFWDFGKAAPTIGLSRLLVWPSCSVAERLGESWGLSI